MISGTYFKMSFISLLKDTRTLVSNSSLSFDDKTTILNLLSDIEEAY